MVLKSLSLCLIIIIIIIIRNHFGSSHGGHLILEPRCTSHLDQTRFLSSECSQMLMVPWSGCRTYGNNRKWERKAFWCEDCSYSCGGNWTRYNGKPFNVHESTKDGNDESAVRRLMEKCLSAILEDKRAIVREAMVWKKLYEPAPKRFHSKNSPRNVTSWKKTKRTSQSELLTQKRNWSLSRRSWRSCHWRRVRSR